MATFERLIRFLDEDGKTCYGDLPMSVSADKIEGKSVKVLSGELNTGFKPTETRKTVKKVNESSFMAPDVKQLIEIDSIASLSTSIHSFHTLHRTQLSASRYRSKCKCQEYTRCSLS